MDIKKDKNGYSLNPVCVWLRPKLFPRYIQTYVNTVDHHLHRRIHSQIVDYTYCPGQDLRSRTVTVHCDQTQ